MTKWTSEDQKLLDQLLDRRQAFRRQLETEVQRVVKNFYYPEISASEIAEGICYNSEDLVKILVGDKSTSIDNNGWIQWNGGECPVDPETRVAIRLRNGQEYASRKAGGLCWEWGGASWDIVAYRLF